MRESKNEENENKWLGVKKWRGRWKIRLYLAGLLSVQGVKGRLRSFGDRREMPGIRIEMAGNDGSWFATIRHGTPMAFASCDLCWVYSTIRREEALASSRESQWRMRLPDERKQSSRKYRSPLLAHNLPLLYKKPIFLAICLLYNSPESDIFVY